jgi:hypothetical protein
VRRLGAGRDVACKTNGAASAQKLRGCLRCSMEVLNQSMSCMKLERCAEKRQRRCYYLETS